MHTPSTETVPATGHRTSFANTRRTAQIAFAALLLIVTAGAPRAAVAGVDQDALAAVGAAVDASCPCSGPAAGGSWRSHGQYLACAGKAARHAARTIGAPAGVARRAVRDRAASDCGRAEPQLAGNVHVCGDGPVLACPTVRTARVDDCGECDAALDGTLVRCARIAAASGARSDVCAGPVARVHAGDGRILEERTGVDCASCLAKLGTPAPAGADCLLAACGGSGPAF